MKHLKLLLVIVGVLVFANVPAATKDYALHQAVLDNDLKLTQRLLSKGAAIDVIGSRKYGYGSALHLAVREGNLDIAKLLLDRGAQVDVLDPDDFTPLHNAAWNGNLEMTKLLLDAGADAEASTYDGDTPLSLAQNNDQAQVAEFLQAKLQPSTTSETKVNSQTASDSTVIDITGTYVSEITSHGHAQGGPQHGKIILLLEQHGNTITGTDSSGKADIRGTRTGNTIKIEFWAPFWSYGAYAVWKVNADGTQLEGSWTDKHTGYGEWNLTKIETDAAQIPDISGTYTSEITHKDTGGYAQQLPRHYFGKNSNIVVNIKQNGNIITGTMSGHSTGVIEGVIKGNEIIFDWEMKPRRSGGIKFGKGIWVVSGDQVTLNGTWKSGSTASSFQPNGIWNLTKIESDAEPPSSETRVESAPVSDSGVIDISGSYYADISGNSRLLKRFLFRPVSEDKLKVEMVQIGSQITGTYNDGEGKIYGDIDGDTILFDWQENSLELLVKANGLLNWEVTSLSAFFIQPQVLVAHSAPAN